MLNLFELEMKLVGLVADGWDDIDWYAEANQWAGIIAGRYGLTVKQVAGIIAALSPQRRWAINLRQTVEFIESHGDAFLHYGHQVRKAQAIFAGADPDDELNGLKERAFYFNIMGNAEQVTIDRHMLTVLEFDGRLTKGRYAKAWDILNRVAEAFDVKPYQAQAAIWSSLAAKDITA